MFCDCHVCLWKKKVSLFINLLYLKLATSHLNKNSLTPFASVVLVFILLYDRGSVLLPEYKHFFWQLKCIPFLNTLEREIKAHTPALKLYYFSTQICARHKISSSPSDGNSESRSHFIARITDCSPLSKALQKHYALQNSRRTKNKITFTMSYNNCILEF